MRLRSLGCTTSALARRRARRAPGPSTRCDRRRRACGRPRGGDCTRRAAWAPAASIAAVPHVERRGAPRAPRRRPRPPPRPTPSSSSGASPLASPGLIGSEPVPLAATAPVPERRQVRLVGGDAGLDRLPRAAGGDARARAGTRSRRGSRRSGAPRRRAPGARGRRRRRRTTGATRAISSCTSSTVSNPKSTSKRAASSCAMRQSSIVVPSGVMRRARRSTRPSRLVVLPPFSPHTEVGRNTSARAEASAVNAPTAITNGAASRPARMRMRSGKSCSGSAPSSTSARMLPAAAASRMPAASRPTLAGDGAPLTGVVVAAGVERDPTGEEARGEPELERAAHVAAPQRGEELHVRERRQRGRGLHDRRRRLGERLATDDHDEVAVATVERADRLLDRAAARRGAVAGERAGELLRHRAGFAGRVAQHRGDVARESAGARGELDHRHAQLDRGAAHAQVQDRELLAEVGGDEHDAPGAVDVGDGRAGETEHDVGGEPVAELRVDVVGAEHALGQARPHVGVLVGAARAAEHRDGSRARRRRARAAVPRRRRRAPRATTPRPARRSCAPSARAPGPRSAPTRSRSGPCRRASPGSPARSRRRGGGRSGSTCSAARRGSRPRTWCTTSRRSAGPTGGRGSGTSSR